MSLLTWATLGVLLYLLGALLTYRYVIPHYEARFVASASLAATAWPLFLPIAITSPNKRIHIPARAEREEADYQEVLRLTEEPTINYDKILDELE